MTDNRVLRQALAHARSNLRVFPCQPGSKVPDTPHGYLDATTDRDQILEWFAGRPDRNIATPTGSPGYDVLDIDYRGEAGNGFAAWRRLYHAGLLDSVSFAVRTPSGGAHYYFAGTDQRTAHLSVHHVDFLAQGGYVMLPPSWIDGKGGYAVTETFPAQGRLDWAAAVRVIDPSREYPASRPLPPVEDLAHLAGRQAAERGTPPPHLLTTEQRIEALARWVAAQREGNRNSGLFWAANRALEAGQGADLSPLAAAARQAGLADPEITTTLNSARRTTQAGPRLEPPDRQPEGAS
jgi:Bifunctional DNA primase/polymerase, N-terminal